MARFQPWQVKTYQPECFTRGVMIVPRRAFSSGFPTESIAQPIDEEGHPLEGGQIGTRAHPAEGRRHFVIR